MKTLCLMVFVLLVHGCTTGDSPLPVMMDDGGVDLGEVADLGLDADEVADLGVDATVLEAALGETCSIESATAESFHDWSIVSGTERTCVVGTTCARVSCSTDPVSGVTLCDDLCRELCSPGQDGIGRGSCPVDFTCNTIFAPLGAGLAELKHVWACSPNF